PQRVQAAAPDVRRANAVAIAGLRYGAEKSGHKQRNHERLDVFLREVACVDFDRDAASAFGRIRAALEAKGAVVGPYDLQIAGHAVSLGLVLVTDNVREFRRVKRLKVENWRRG